ncbi:MAG: GerMN domain-containing protein [Bacillota bacterium]|nr:GerMN domain-containing protein [Bacillota bacterium]
MRKPVCIIICCFVFLSMFTGCGLLQKIGLEKEANDELQPASSIAMGEEEAKKLSDKLPIHLYFANEDNSKLKLEVRYIPIKDAKKSVNNLAGIVVKELIKGPTKSGLKPTIPEGTKLKTSVSIKSGVATVNLSKDFADKHPGGKDAERITIYSIVNSLTEIKDIQKVKFLINGEVRESYKGSFKFDAAFPRNVALISNEVTSVLPSPTSTDNQKTDDKSKDKKDDKTKGKDDKNNSSKGKENNSDKSSSITSDSGDTMDDSDPSFNNGGGEGAEDGGDILE